jgi:hypothetical protein
MLFTSGEVDFCDSISCCRAASTWGSMACTLGMLPRLGSPSGAS